MIIRELARLADVGESRSPCDPRRQGNRTPPRVRTEVEPLHPPRGSPPPFAGGSTARMRPCEPSLLTTLDEQSARASGPGRMGAEDLADLASAVPGCWEATTPPTSRDLLPLLSTMEAQTPPRSCRLAPNAKPAEMRRGCTATGKNA